MELHPELSNAGSPCTDDGATRNDASQGKRRFQLSVPVVFSRC